MYAPQSPVVTISIKEEVVRETKDFVELLTKVALGDGVPLAAPKVTLPAPLFPKLLRDPLGIVASGAQVKGMVMGKRVFATMKVWGRDEMDLEELDIKTNVGFYGRMWDVPMVVGGVPLNDFWIIGQKEDGTWVKLEVDDDEPHR